MIENFLLLSIYEVVRHCEGAPSMRGAATEAIPCIKKNFHKGIAASRTSLKAILSGFAMTVMFLAITVPSQAQESLIYDDPLAAYKEGLKLFEQKNYVTAKKLFQQTIDAPVKVLSGENQTISKNARFYAAFCALELFQPDAEKLLLDMIEVYDEPPMKRLAYYYLGKYYFREKNYGDAIKWFEKVETSDLNNETIAEYKFQLAYCYFFRKKLDDAGRLFKEVRNIKNKYYYPANYYYGYIAFENKDFNEAMESFERIKDSKTYAKILPYYIAQVHYYRKEYSELVNYLSGVMSDSLKYYSELNQILGQAYFEQGKYEKAIKTLTIYMTQSGKVRKEDIYQLGYAHYKAGDYKEAIIQFEQLDNQKDTVGQNALYLLGICHLKTDNKSNAYSAFQRASQMNFDPFITGNALFSHAKLSYELGFETEAIKAFQKYVDEYDNRENAEEAKELLTEMFLNTRNFEAAIKVIESVKNPSARIKKAYQEVTYYRGLEQYNEKSFDEALRLFDVSLQNPTNTEIKSLCYYWKGESFFAKKDFENAGQEYLQFLNLSKINSLQENDWYEANALYGAGYSFLKQKKFGDALPYFNQCVTRIKPLGNKQLKDKVLPDALLRSADCSFMVKDYNASLANYSEIISGKKTGTDYALFQKGMILGLQGKMEEKVSTLQTIETQHPASIYLDDALYETGVAYLALDKKQSAIQVFKKITEKYPNSVYVAKSYLKLGLAYYPEDIDKAIDSYKKVITNFKNSDEAKQAVIAIKDISKEEGAKYLEGIQLTASEKDSISYSAAESQFVKGNYEQAITSFSSYLVEFKEGFFELPAHFYRGECYYTNKNQEQALQDYLFVIDAGKNMFTEKALAKTSWLVFENKNYQQAFEYYQLLLENAAYKENIYAANLGLMRCAYQLGKMNELKQYANVVLNSPDALPEHDTEAEFYLGKAAFEEKDYDAAAKLFKKTAEATTTIIGSEAKYLIAEISFIKGNYKQSLEECKAMVEQKPTHEYWRVKGFILIADNYYKQGNTFQAKATLQSILDNYKGEELKQIAQDKLDKILEEEKAKQKLEIVSDTGSTLEEDTTESIELVVPNDTIDEK